MESLIGEVRKVNRARIDQVSSASVFVDRRTRIKTGRSDIRDVSGRVLANDDASPTFRRASLDPVRIATINRDLSKTDRPRDYQIRCNRRLPGAIRHNLLLSHCHPRAKNSRAPSALNAITSIMPIAPKTLSTDL